MDIKILIILAIGILIRRYVVAISKKNEMELKNYNAIEYAKKNSKILALLHTSFYIFAIIEFFIRKVQFDNIALIGLIIYILSFISLFYVISQLKGIWTTKVIISDKHYVNKSFFFKYIKHPNYFLNLIPEIFSIFLISKAYITFFVMFPLYIIIIITRVIEEEKVMKNRFSEY